VTFDKRHRNIVFSFLLFTGLCLILFIVKWDTDFAAAGLTFATDIVAIIVGLFFILLKLLKVTVSKTNFIYSYFGVLNLILGLLSFGAIFYYRSFTSGLILLTLTQIFIGLFILSNIFKNEKSSD